MPLYEDRGESSAQPMTDRRELCKRIGLLGSAVLLAGISSLARAMTDAERPPSKLGEQGLPRRQLGRTGVTVPILALGGWHIPENERGRRLSNRAGGHRRRTDVFPTTRGTITTIGAKR